MQSISHPRKMETRYMACLEGTRN